MDDMKTLADSTRSFGIRFYLVWTQHADGSSMGLGRTGGLEKEHAMERERASEQSVGLASSDAVVVTLEIRKRTVRGLVQR